VGSELGELVGGFWVVGKADRGLVRGWDVDGDRFFIRNRHRPAGDLML